MRRKKRHRLPKVTDEADQWGTVPLGQDPPIGPWGPMGRIQAYGNIARAWNRGTPRQRRAAAVFLAVICLPTLGGVIVWLIDALRFD
ncbi:MAG: hypothetical protein AB1679_36035 [Actinomycetota bacterium]